ncbi:MAG TPA: LuxR C-terminal-related transcriptional regulator [Polyangiaceae bacterium]|nr:LuxR C-terminal-related transcriptional regulator [Polyangiaceae bacterium]
MAYRLLSVAAMHTVVMHAESEQVREPLRLLFANANTTSLTISDARDSWRRLAEHRLSTVMSFVHEGHALLVLVETELANQAGVVPRYWPLLESVLLGTGRKVLCFDRNLHTSTLAQGLRHTLAGIGLNCSPARVPLVLALWAHVAAGSATHELKVSRAEFGGRRYLTLRTMLYSKAWDALTAAERKVLELRAMGNTYADIARERKTSCRTVANQLAAATHRLGVSGRLDLVRRMASAV